MKCLLCFLDRVRIHTTRARSRQCAPRSSPERQSNRVSPNQDPNRRNLPIHHSQTNDSHPDPRQPTIFGPGESPSTPSLRNADPSLQSKPSPECPEADADQVASLVCKLQRKVIRYVEGLSLQSDERSLARSRIYEIVISLAQSATRNPEEYKEVARSLQEELIKPLSSLSRANTDLIEICSLGHEINSTIKEIGRNYAFEEVDRNRSTKGKRTEFPAVKRDGTPLLEEVEFEDHVSNE
ncbi:hypothetical protein PV04_08246 [Phialophora macrospora]|uniref:Uncharacterized protein n=1 Tax=Phialophora macrospora TaxID=1851006 RepID=A0A0D2DVB3_9EURO|nr:hypothetical protein PV04_08246 [Phialophora macrospora]